MSHVHAIKIEMDHLMHSPYDKHDVHKCSQVQVILYKQALLHLGLL